MFLALFNGVICFPIKKKTKIKYIKKIEKTFVEKFKILVESNYFLLLHLRITTKIKLIYFKILIIVNPFEN